MAQKRIQYISSEEIVKLESSIKQKRDRLLLKILYETGCTVNEAVNIAKDDIDGAHNRISFPGSITKSKQAKTSIISQELAAKITSYTDELEKEGIKSRYLFASRQSESMTTKRARQLILLYGKKAGLGKVLPQMLRYAHVLHAAEKGVPLEAIERQTGINKIRLVQIMDSVTRQEPADDYMKFFGSDGLDVAVKETRETKDIKEIKETKETKETKATKEKKS
ncbi:TPA: site-specific integrase [Candidatus Woesearchaeota archaeon]|nr:site-specific integrase [Candidatus Woesearchaeota archaeon]